MPVRSAFARAASVGALAAAQDLAALCHDRFDGVEQCLHRVVVDQRTFLDTGRHEIDPTGSRHAYIHGNSDGSCREYKCFL